MYRDFNVIVYETPEEMTFGLLKAIGVEVKPDGSLFDTEIRVPLQFDGKTIKVTIDPNNVHYAGESEIMFEPLKNLKMTSTVLGLVLDKLRVQEGRETLSFFTEDRFDDNGYKQTRMILKLVNEPDLVSDWYFNKCLAYDQIMFNLAETDVGLHFVDYSLEDLKALRG